MKFNKISKTAKQPAKSWTNKEVATFHYFNPNGLCAEKQALDTIISEMVDQGLCKTGAIIAYGSLNYHFTDSLRDLMQAKRVCPHKLYSVLECLRFNIESATNFINETKGQ
jgi:hypothetical protein